MSVIELETENELVYNFFPNSSGSQQFRVKARNDAHIALSTAAAEVNPMYEIFIGGWENKKSVIRKNRTPPDLVEVPTPDILSENEFRGFWIRWQDGSITVGRENERLPFMSCDLDPITIEYIGVCTGWGATGSWILEKRNIGGEGGGGGERPTPGAELWVGARNGQVPPRAYPGGEDNGEPVYVIRATFQGGLIPGKLIQSHGVGYLAWNGKEHAVPDYEVLCDFQGQFIAGSGNNIPPNAVTAGETEDGEPLYIGRVAHEGTLTVGKIQQSHARCYIAYGGKEIPFTEYEILVR